MLLDQYDKDQKAILRPEHVVKKKKEFPETVVFEFSQALIMETAKRYKGVEAGHLVSVAGNTPIYNIDYHGRELGISQCWIGASVRSSRTHTAAIRPQRHEKYIDKEKDHEKLLCNIYISVSRQQGRFSSGSEASGRYYQKRTGLPQI